MDPLKKMLAGNKKNNENVAPKAAPPIIPVIIPVIPSPGKLGIRVQCGAGPLEVLEAAGVDGGASGEVAMAKKTQEKNPFFCNENWLVVQPI